MFERVNTNNYEEFLQKLISNEYKSYFFNEIHHCQDKGMILRHDIDFDCALAYDMALLENKLGIKSTYFFLTSSEYYNIEYKSNYDCIRGIKELGHTISIHFDPVNENLEKGLKSEADYFKSLFDVEIDIISFHLPKNYILEYNELIGGIEHTYQAKFCRDIKYFSDSTGIWRFGHPFNSTEFKEKKNLQILTHPIWWMITSEKISNNEKLKLYYKNRIEQLQRQFSASNLHLTKIYEQIF